MEIIRKMNKNRVNVKLEAIKNKDTAEILKKHTWLPNIGYPESEQQIREWLQTRADILEAALNCKSDEEATQLLNNEQTAFQKNPDDYASDGTKQASELTPTEFDQLCRIRLLKFALAETKSL